jgi:hypothetical protein
VLGVLSISGHSTAITLRVDSAGTAGSGDLAYTSNDYASYNTTAVV